MAENTSSNSTTPATLASGRVFVTGGGGLVGAALLRQLLQRQQTVRALYHTQLPVLLSAEEKARIEWIQGDVLDTGLLNDAMHDCMQVYHCAAVVSFHPKRRRQMYKINVEGTANVVNTALLNSHTKLVHVSSVAALGRIRKNEVVTEKSEWSEETNNSHYGKTKYLAELEVWRGIGEGLNAVIVNPTIILGEARWDHGSSALFKKAWEEFPWYTTGSTGFVDAVDVAAAMIALMNSSSSAERFILSNETLTYQQLLSQIAVTFGKRPPRLQGKAFLLELAWRLEALKAAITGAEPLVTKETVRTSLHSTRYNNEKLLQALPQFSYTPLSDTLLRTCNWLRQYYQLQN